MGALLEPVGPLPASTYWRRRAVVGVVLVLLLLVVLKACGGGGGDDPSPQALVPASATATPSPSRVPVSRTPTARPTPSAAPTSATPIGACATRTGLRLAVTTDAQRYPVGSTARFTLSITNAGTAPCRIGLGQGSLELRVASGDDRIWSSDDCAPGGPLGPEVLSVGERQTTRLSWSLTRSLPGCEGDRSDVRPGTYVLGARAGALFSPTTTFRVVAAG